MQLYAEAILIAVLTTLSHQAVQSAASKKQNQNESEDILPEVQHAARDRRDVYGAAGGYGSYSGGGSYGCYCPYQQCDTNSDILLYFSAGVILGLLFTMIQPAMMMMGAATGRQQPLDGSAIPGFTLTNLPTLLSNDIAPLALDMISVYSRSSKIPDCGRRWLCEVTQKSLKQGGLRARLTSISSVAASWFMKDMKTFVENITEDHNGEVFDCSLLGLHCQSFFDNESETITSQT